MNLGQKPFDGTEETLDSPVVSDAELQAVLQAIAKEDLGEPAHQASPYDDWATVDSICEVTGRSRAEIEGIVLALRREDLAARISGRLRELEEPLYRVERPGHHPPSSVEHILRDRQVKTILDKMGQPLIPKRVKSDQELRNEKSSDLLGRIIAYLLTGVVVFIALYAIVQSLASR
ncbi:MAG: hypothetical protein JSS71_03695 [Armatimonadetes bacterium]|nr:hypothetical protein [Armatimonadota bacterium]MBX3108486.1 hypothetical protein [Fimbriimonadaceae bacterium]